MNVNFVYEYNLGAEGLKKTYIELEEKLQLVLYSMQQCMYYLNYINNDLFDVYKIDNEKVDSIKIQKMKEKLKQRINYLRYTVIPEIQIIKNNF